MTNDFTWPIPFVELSDGSLTLRGLKASDADDIYLCAIDDRMKKYTQVPYEYTREMALDFATRQTSHIVFALQCDEFGERYCGNIEARLVDASIPSVSIGYNTAPWARGRGLQARALDLLMKYCFANGINRVEVRAAVDNSASRHVAEVAGCQFEGIMRHGENLHGKLQDLAVYAKLAAD